MALLGGLGIPEVALGSGGDLKLGPQVKRAGAQLFSFSLFLAPSLKKQKKNLLLGSIHGLIIS